MESAHYTILALNVLLGFSLGWPLARRLSDAAGGHHSWSRYYILLILVYLIESFAFAASMSTNILSIILAVVWGSLLGRRFRRARSQPRESRQIALRFSFYTSLPAASFLCVPIVMALGGWSVLSADDGIRFGVPNFLPWPLNTILGFCVAVALVAVVCKVVITTGIVRLMTGREEQMA